MKTRVINLTRDLSLITAARGARLPRITELRHVAHVFVVPTYLITPAGATHQDQLNVLDERAIFAMMNELEDDQRTVLQEMLSSPLEPNPKQIQPADPYSCRCHLLDFTRLHDDFMEWQSRHRSFSQTASHLIDPSSVEEADFADCLEMLRIGYQDIDSAIGSDQRKQLQEGDFLLFNTGWESLAKEHHDLNHPIFQCWHPVLLHPYLDAEATDYLLDTLKVFGVGTDAMSLEFPLAICDIDYCLDYVSKTHSSLLAKGFFRRNVKVYAFPYHHMRFLRSGRIIIENLSIQKACFARKHWPEQPSESESCDHSDLLDDEIPTHIVGALRVHPLTYARLDYGISSQLVTAVLEVAYD